MSAAQFDETFKDIYSGGNPRWTSGAASKDWLHKYQNIIEFIPNHGGMKLLAPLCGDDYFVKHAWDMGLDVTGVEWSGVAMNKMKEYFSQENSVEFQQPPGGSDVVQSSSERVSLFNVGWDAFGPYAAANEADKYDIIYDKDAFGYLKPEERAAYVETLDKVLKPKGFIYMEVKNRADGGPEGPPFHVGAEQIEKQWSKYGAKIVKDFGVQPGVKLPPGMTHVAFMLQRE
eukprot:GFYU01032326.1.p1 GENE.GFYU01032326.1~~GFYU01032326.1.p1  ORF type:complete len:252 (-),score=40.61 GFYU01032326.1:51-740(-)